MKTFLVAVSLILASGFLMPAAAESTPVAMGRNPVFDGKIEPGEWDDATMVVLKNLDNPDDSAYGYIKQNDSYLWVAFMVPDDVNGIAMLIDENNDKGTMLDDDDFGLMSGAGGGMSEYAGTSWSWREASGWEAMADTTGDGWTAEYKIGFPKLGLSAGTAHDIGATLGAWNTSGGAYLVWPSGRITDNPSTWGTLTSPDDWLSIRETPPPPAPAGITISPNPIKGSSYIDASGFAPGALFRVYSTEGRLVRTIALSQGVTLFDSKDDKGVRLQAGAYFYKANDKDHTVTGSIILLK
jgi:hypothetical protein